MAELLADYMQITYDSINFNIVNMSSTNFRLDISNLLSTKKKPGTKYPAFLFCPLYLISYH